MTVRTCIHTKTNGVQCGSPAMRGELRCYFHYRQQKPITNFSQIPDTTTPQGRIQAIRSISMALQHHRIDPEVARAPVRHAVGDSELMESIF